MLDRAKAEIAKVRLGRSIGVGVILRWLGRPEPDFNDPGFNAWVRSADALHAALVASGVARTHVRGGCELLTPTREELERVCIECGHRFRSESTTCPACGAVGEPPGGA